MISVITAVHNQRSMNQLFLDRLHANTRHPFELIVIDNASSDGSGDVFERAGATVIRNSENLSYPRSQNLGIARARHDWLAFLNNDVIVCPGWDELLLRSMESNGLEVATSCGIERVESALATRVLRRRWRLIRNALTVLGTGPKSLRWMHRLMYPDWEGFCAARRSRFAGQVQEGFVGNTVMIRRGALDKIGLWDERIQDADFDLFLRVAQRRRSHGDIREVHIALDCFVHHYVRLTAKGGYPPFADRDRLIPLEQKWTPEQLAWLPPQEGGAL